MNIKEKVITKIVIK